MRRCGVTDFTCRLWADRVCTYRSTSTWFSILQVAVLPMRRSLFRPVWNSRKRGSFLLSQIEERLRDWFWSRTEHLNTQDSPAGHIHFAKLPGMWEKTLTVREPGEPGGPGRSNYPHEASWRMCYATCPEVSSAGKTFGITGWQIGLRPTKFVLTWERVEVVTPWIIGWRDWRDEDDQVNQVIMKWYRFDDLIPGYGCGGWLIGPSQWMEPIQRFMPNLQLGAERMISISQYFFNFRWFYDHFSFF